MFKKVVFAVVALVVSIGSAFAQVDVNKADQAALDGIKGVGPKTSRAILDERTKGGDFKNWADFQARVKGIGEKNSVRLSEAGLTVNGLGKEGVPLTEAKSGKSVKTVPAKASALASASIQSEPK